MRDESTVRQDSDDIGARISPGLGDGAVRTLVALYQQGGSLATPDLWPIAKQVAADCGGGDAEAREALDVLRMAGFLEATAGFAVGVLTSNGVRMGERLCRRDPPVGNVEG